MVGPPEVYVKQGSTLSLTCLVSQAVENAAIFWYHDMSVLDTNWPTLGRPLPSSSSSSSSLSSLGSAVVGPTRIRVDVQHDPPSTSVTSRLRIDNVQLGHSGNYTCLPTAADPAFVVVHVINGKF